MESAKKCAFWDCDTAIQTGPVFCDDHYQESLNGLIDEDYYTVTRISGPRVRSLALLDKTRSSSRRKVSSPTDRY